MRSLLPCHAWLRYDQLLRRCLATGCDSMQAARGLAGRVVTGFSNLDKSLEDRGILSELTTDKSDREVQERGPENALTREVGSC